MLAAVTESSGLVLIVVLELVLVPGSRCHSGSRCSHAITSLVLYRGIELHMLDGCQRLPSGIRWPVRQAHHCGLARLVPPCLPLWRSFWWLPQFSHMKVVPEGLSSQSSFFLTLSVKWGFGWLSQTSASPSHSGKSSPVWGFATASHQASISFWSLS